MTMSEIARRIGIEDFVRLHRSGIMCPDAILAVRLENEGHGGEVLLRDGSITPVRRSGLRRRHEESDSIL